MRSFCFSICLVGGGGKLAWRALENSLQAREQRVQKKYIFFFFNFGFKGRRKKTISQEEKSLIRMPPQ